MTMCPTPLVPSPREEKRTCSPLTTFPSAPPYTAATTADAISAAPGNANLCTRTPAASHPAQETDRLANKEAAA